ncbi:polysaccharide deacetylase family protein [Echinicola marina]|uniref:polysaccharide deacetylase family protein n=1 Tax=Echinicola marina TaxID=2859768 RepID=UPI001CF6C0F7|nr:polysaccharide deacetylase family protein [Echinicola marina]UCS92004.1 polysaccharide deacetylase family protein [Echinicola marina]
MRNSIFTISLDFELHWGRFDKFPLAAEREYYQNARMAIPKILDLFADFGIEATWATVGMLFAESWDEWKDYLPEDFPNYDNIKLSAYEWAAKNMHEAPNCLFAPDLITRIINSPGQEIGSHTFSHFYTQEKGQELSQFRADLKMAKKIAKDKFGLSLSSLVFPRNQYGPESIAICKEEGFEVYRGNPSDWFWKSPEKSNLLKKVFRTGDTLYALGNRTSYPKEQIFDEASGMINIPASRLLRPYRQPSIFNHRRIQRITEEMTLAAKKGEVYHLWWHPHNFGTYTSDNLSFLKVILQHFKGLKEEYGMQSCNMLSLSGAHKKVKAVS